MKLKLAYLLIVLSTLGLPLFAQTSASAQLASPPRSSTARVWAEQVTNFVANPRMGASFRALDVAEWFKALIPPSSLKVDHTHGIGFGSNPEKGIVILEYDLDGYEGAPKGMRRVGWVRIYMPKTDTDGVDVLSLVADLMRRKLQRPWRYYVPTPNKSYYWEQRKSLSRVSVDLDLSVPERDHTPNEGPWVIVSFGRVEGFGEP